MNQPQDSEPGTIPVYADFDQTALDREYSPSSCIDDINEYLDAYAQRSQVAKNAASQAGLCERNVCYGDGTEETLDMFVPPDAGQAPLQIYIHGGYWQLLSKDESSFAAPMFQQHGSYFAAINYTLAPRKTLSAIVEENRHAIAYLYEHATRWGFDRDRMYLSGSSAGAHLAMMMLLTDWSTFGTPCDVIKGVCAVSGVYDLEPVRLSYVNDMVGMDKAEAAINSPALKRLKNRCPVVLAYGDHETTEFKRQSNEYRDALRKDDVAVAFREIPNRNHFDVIMDLADDQSWLSQQVLRQMGLS